MPATIEVHKESVENLLKTGNENVFIVPEYQRPYAWGTEQVETLFNDLWSFTEALGDSNLKNTYFLGTIVSHKTDGEQEIIDGQQRLTTLFLFLRAVYTHLQNGAVDKKALFFMRRIEATIWKCDKHTGEPINDSVLLKSRVINNEGNQILWDILRTGRADEKAEDNYSENYRKLQELYEAKSKESPLMIYDFLVVLLEKTILLPIEANTREDALTIFSTLNNRGLPLSDADIFKAKIYSSLENEKKQAFIEQWQELEECAADASESIRQLFYYYMFYLRALENDTKTTTPGLRKFYTDEKLILPQLMNDLKIIMNLWSFTANHSELEDEPWTKNTEIAKMLDILSSYPNEFWKYPVVVYYLSHRTKENFEHSFLRFLKKFTLEILVKYQEEPNVNRAKPAILKLNVAIIQTGTPVFEFKQIDFEALRKMIRAPHVNTVRMVLKIIAYSEQDELLPPKWETEHIFPKKWKTSYFTNISDDIVREKIEHIGNKIPFEKRLNIVAGNGYFQKKKAEYIRSQIAVVRAIGNSNIVEWSLDDIYERDIRLSDMLISIFKQWNSEYLKNSEVNI